MGKAPSKNEVIINDLNDEDLGDFRYFKTTRTAVLTYGHINVDYRSKDGTWNVWRGILTIGIANAVDSYVKSFNGECIIKKCKDEAHLVEFSRECEIYDKMRRVKIKCVPWTIKCPLKDTIIMEDLREYHELRFGDDLNKVRAAIKHLHKNNIIHRDLFKDNILIGPDGDVKIVDFNVASNSPVTDLPIRTVLIDFMRDRNQQYVTKDFELLYFEELVIPSLGNLRQGIIRDVRNYEHQYN